MPRREILYFILLFFELQKQDTCTNKIDSYRKKKRCKQNLILYWIIFKTWLVEVGGCIRKNFLNFFGILRENVL